MFEILLHGLPGVNHAGPFNIGGPEMIALLVIVLLIFGPKNLPKLAKSMGSAIRDFKRGMKGVDPEINDMEEEESEPVETAAQITSTPREANQPRSPVAEPAPVEKVK